MDEPIQPDIPQHPTVTLSLPAFLELLWGSREIAYPEEKILLIIDRLDPSRIYCDIQPTRDGSMTGVWRKNAWKIEYYNRGEDKKRMDARVNEHETRKLKVKELAEAIANTLGLPKDDPSANMIAHGIVHKGQRKVAATYGVEI